MIKIGAKVRVHSKEEIVSALAETVEIVAEAGLTEDEFKVLGPQILALVSQHQIEVEQRQPLPIAEGFTLPRPAGH